MEIVATVKSLLLARLLRAVLGVVVGAAMAAGLMTVAVETWVLIGFKVVPEN